MAKIRKSAESYDKAIGDSMVAFSFRSGITAQHTDVNLDLAPLQTIRATG
jgi:hypothetical protein